MAHQFYFNPYILDNLPAPARGFDVVQDISEPKLRMYITSRGVKTFFVRKRVRGKDKRILIGNYPDVDIEDARGAVQNILQEALKSPPVRRKKISFKKFLDLYLQNRVRRCEDSYVKLVRAIDLHLSDLFEKNISDINATDIKNVLDNITGRAIAGRMQELLQSVFKYAIEMGYVKKNPTDDVEKIVQTRRVRPLNRAGLHRLIAAIDKEPNQTLRAAFYMLIYGFVPKSKIFSMAWEDLDFNHDMWLSHPLSDRAIVLLQDLPQNGHWVFAGRGGMHLMDPRTAWRRIAISAGIPNLTMDDVHKFLMRQLVWASDKEDLRVNINTLLDDIFDHSI
ncbi:MAG: integrase family protein [Alphaproteobacteria bacterium]|nr:integrase family protein [Alphaproteobacteria bacterium]